MYIISALYTLKNTGLKTTEVGVKMDKHNRWVKTTQLLGLSIFNPAWVVFNPDFFLECIK